MKKITDIIMLGGGSWGTAVAKVLAENGHTVHLWCREQEVADEINTFHTNKQFLPDISLPLSIIAYTDFTQVMNKSLWVFETVPVNYLRSIVNQISSCVTPQHIWVVLSKGIEQNSFLLPTAIINDTLGYKAQSVVVSGPSFAKELAEKQYTAVTVASNHTELLEPLCGILDNAYFKAVPYDDPIGVQIGGALKNVCALASGIVQGNGGKHNTAAYVLTKGLQELSILAQHMGGKREALYELAGVGDLILTCTGSLSKNFTAGRLFAVHRSLSELQKQFATLPEGINTVQSVYQIIKRDNLTLPLFQAVYRYIFEQGSYSDLLGC